MFMTEEEKRKKEIEDAAAAQKASENKFGLPLSGLPSNSPKQSPAAQPPVETNLLLESDDKLDASHVDAVVQMYVDKYSKKADGSPNPDYKAPEKQADGKTKLSFSSEKEALDFLTEAAKSGKNFKFSSPNSGISGYAKDGKLYQTNGKLYGSESNASEEEHQTQTPQHK
jgi:hypothetical protein